MKFCPKCGVTVKEEAKFCHNCGCTLTSKLNNVIKINKAKKLQDEESQDEAYTLSYKSQDIKSALQQKVQTNNSSNSSNNSNNNSNSNSNSNSNNSNNSSRILIAGIIIVCVIVGVFVYVGKTISDPKREVTSFQNAVSKNDAAALSKMLYTSDERMKLTSDSVGPILQSFKTTPSDFSDVINNLSNQAINLKDGGTENQTSNLYITKVGSTLLFFPKYKIAVKPTYFTITSDVEGADILINGKQIAKTDSKNFSKQIGPYIPGTYTIIGKASGDFGDIHNQTKVDSLSTKDQSNTVDALKGLYIHVSSDYNNNKVYINGKDTGKSVNSGDIIGPIASGSNIYAITGYNGTQIKSSYSNLSDGAKTVYFDYSTQEDTVEQQKSDISNMVTGYSYALASALTNGDTKSLQAYMYPGSKLYNQQMDNVKNYYKDNNSFNEQYDSAVVNSYKMDEDSKSGTVNTTEVYDINEHADDPNSEAQTKTYENVYKFQYNDTTHSLQLSERISAIEK